MTSVSRRRVTALCVALLVFAACSSSGSSERTLSRAEVETVMPTATDLGEGWTPGDVDESGEDAGPAFEDQCPELARLGGTLTEDDDGTDIEAAFEHTDARQIEITLNPDAREVSDEEVDELVEAVNACGELTFTDDAGFETTAALTAEPTGAYGDQGVRLSVAAEISGAGLPQPVALNIDAHTYRRGNVGVEVLVTDGITEDLQVTPSDIDQLDSLAARIDTDLEELFME
jgi:hypothetical protein